jgi:hypothetical protein
MIVTLPRALLGLKFLQSLAHPMLEENKAAVGWLGRGLGHCPFSFNNSTSFFINSLSRLYPSRTIL